MKKAAYAIVGLVVASVAYFSVATTSPFPPWLDDLTGDVTISKLGVTSLSTGNIDQADLEIPDGSDLYVKRTARFEYNVAVQGGSVGNYGTGVTLPAKSIVTDSYFYIVTAFSEATGGTPTIAVTCEDAGNLRAANAFSTTVATDLVIRATTAGAATGTAGTFVKNIASDCEIRVSVATHSFAAGHFDGWVEYQIAE